MSTNNYVVITSQSACGLEILNHTLLKIITTVSPDGLSHRINIKQNFQMYRNTRECEVSKGIQAIKLPTKSGNVMRTALFMHIHENLSTEYSVMRWRQASLNKSLIQAKALREQNREAWESFYRPFAGPLALYSKHESFIWLEKT